MTGGLGNAPCELQERPAFLVRCEEMSERAQACRKKLSECQRLAMATSDLQFGRCIWTSSSSGANWPNRPKRSHRHGR